ncbi:vesicle transport protein [Plasmopara halstedii]|uniref:Vesicle transport protein n=1 Tax=Plasmopara halstedii TaxID=4781 RepID=A0A0P1AN40_PLAHL|nr:vesicle transport protein [Plasmopara halstedii]CEG42566.1 vesicle transport protein [Plasmopara halstedii]|eukprot:XP_024578935.1 vesicle transport protein [Plasmopara halstedii]
MMDTLRWQRQKLLDPESGEPTEDSLRSDAGVSLCPSLSYHERFIGCITCFLLGFILSLGSTFRLAKLMHGNPAPFAIAYTIGNILSIGSTTFFVGPWKQMQTMFHTKRRYSAVFYVSFIFVTLLLCFSHHIHHRLFFVLISLLVQFMALIWYTLSYVPYGRTIAKTTCKRFLGLSNDDDM